MADDSWGGEVGFDEGRVVAALSAPSGPGSPGGHRPGPPREFRFAGGAVPEGRDVDLPPEDTERYLTSLAEEQVALARAIPSLASVPRPVDPGPDGAGAPERITIDRSTLFSLLLVDGQRTVQALCEQRGERGAAQTLKELAWLAGSGLVVIDAGARGPARRTARCAPAGRPCRTPAGPRAGARAGARHTPGVTFRGPGPRTSAFVAGPAGPGRWSQPGTGPQTGAPGGGWGRGLKPSGWAGTGTRRRPCATGAHPGADPAGAGPAVAFLVAAERLAGRLPQ